MARENEAEDARRFEGACLCGTVRFEVAPPTLFCGHCHCSTCRRAHGAAFVTWVGVPEKQFRFTAGEGDVARYATETGATRTFCRRCGSTLLYQGPRWAGEVHVARGNIPGAIDRDPGGHAYVDHRAAWWNIDDDLPRYGGETGVEPKER
jgi:hypothetical protein